MKKKNILYKPLIFLGAGIIGAKAGAEYYHRSVIKELVPDYLKDEIICQYLIDDINSLDSPILKDDNVENVLQKLKILHLNMRLNDDLSILERCPSLSEVKIYDAELLTEKDIKYINNSYASKITLLFSKGFLKNRDNKFDISKIKKTNITIDLLDGQTELNHLVFINYLQNYTDSMFSDSFNINKYKNLDNKINRIIYDLNIDKNFPDKNKILIIANYIWNKIQYDADVANYSMENASFAAKQLGTEKQIYYNENDLSSILNSDKEEVDGICVNYASLFDIIAYKLNIKTRIIGGTNQNNIGHLWNVVYFGNNEKKYIDLTWSDNEGNINNYSNYLHGIKYKFNNGELKDIYYSSLGVNYYNLLIASIFENINDTHTEFNLYEDINSLTQKESKQQLKDFLIELKKNIEKEKPPKLNMLVYGIFSGIVSLRIKSILSDKKEMKKNLYNKRV